LGQSLESERFRPNHQTSQVQIIGLEQSDLHMFDAIVIGAAEIDYLPGRPSISPFFNDSVRQSLGLEGYLAQKDRGFAYFRRLLALAEPTTYTDGKASPLEVANLMVSYRCMENDEPIVPSPWLEALQMRHNYIYGKALRSTQIEQWLTSASLTESSSVAMARDKPDISRATAIEGLLPNRISASAYQELIDCPYRFFVSRCLRLVAADRVKAYLEKSDYGERVHLCLQAFHVPVAGLPPPFESVVTKDNSQLALERLLSISDQVFSQDIEDNFAHRAWRETWATIAPKYIDWLIEHQAQWRLEQAEANLKAEINPSLTLNARMDRIDRNKDGRAIIDYKTGAIAKTEAVLTGESVQLPFYAWVLQQSSASGQTAIPVAEIAHLGLDQKGVRLKNRISGDVLHDLSSHNADRLLQVLEQLRNGQTMPAWGDEEICVHCDAEGLCRKEYRR
jgi:ATP-dependent helicase/nuclease subunit B